MSKSSSKTFLQAIKRPEPHVFEPLGRVCGYDTGSSFCYRTEDNSVHPDKSSSDAAFIGGIMETRSGQLRMRFPADPETTRRLESLTHEPLSWRYRLRRWLQVGWRRRK